MSTYPRRRLRDNWDNRRLILAGSNRSRSNEGPLISPSAGGPAGIGWEIYQGEHEYLCGKVASKFVMENNAPRQGRGIR